MVFFLLNGQNLLTKCDEIYLSTVPYSILSTNIDIVKLFCVLHNKVALLTRDVLSGEQEIVTKEFIERFYLTIYI